MNITKDLPERDTLLIPSSILREDIFKLLRNETTLVVISPGIRTVLILMDSRDVDPEEEIGQPGGQGWVAEIGVDYQNG